jgi:D-alanyl-lipoteichoic acid acyltransferase DltB (MBOAT superfamily)
MLFNTIDFIIFFIVVLTTLTAIKTSKFQHVFLLLASYFFFYYTSNYLIVLLIFTTVWDYYFGGMIYKAKNIKTKKLILIASLAGNLGLLGFFKYADFAIMQFNVLGNYFDLGTNIPLLDLALPIAISFYTFHSITYTVGIYRNQIAPVKSFTEYAIFVAFFPQLVAGPILRAKEFLPQLREKIDAFEVGTKLRHIVITEANLKIGITMMVLGFFKKMFFADNIAPFVNEIFAKPLGLDSFTIVSGTIAFGIQVYCDFSGYSDIAIGAALIMGFKIPPNFNKPFFSTSPSEFWRRWHISLSSWVKDYLFLPFVYRKIGSDFILFSGILLTFLVLGLWHGAGWNFVFFGFIHGIYVLVETIIRKRSPKLEQHVFFKRNVGKIFSILATQYLVFLAWIAFRVNDTNNMLYSMEKFVFLDFQTVNIIPFLISHKLPFAFIILFIVLHLISYRTKNLQEKISQLKTWKWTVFLIIVLTSIIFFYDNNSSDFIYFRF